MKMNRIMIAAPKSGSGKTVVTCLLLQTLKDAGRQTVSCKCGPDYIDPMFHEAVIGVPARNLDTFFTGEERTRALFLDSAEGRDIAVLEGVMGLYDGLGGIRQEGSSYHLAKVTKTPIVLVVDAKGMGRSVLSLIAGFLAYDKARLIKGVLLNRISKGYYETIKPLIEEELGIPAVGFLPEKEELHIESRHLGLVAPGESGKIRDRLRTAAEEFVKTVSLERMLAIAEGAEELEYGREGGEKPEQSREAVEEAEQGQGAVEEVEQGQETVEEGREGEEKPKQGREAVEEAEQGREAAGVKQETEEGIRWRSDGSRIVNERPRGKERPVIAVARDEAFCFYYMDNLRMLEKYGAEIRFFSPLRDGGLPEGSHGLLLGGGYPELYAGRLSGNKKMLAAVRTASESGMPVVAECGGFLYLHSVMTDQEGICHDMAGVIPAACFDTGKLVRFGYIEIQEKQGFFLPEGERIKGHEFHYYDSTDNGNGTIAIKPVTGREYSCIMVDETHWMGFPHLYYPSNPIFARAFVEKAGKYKLDLHACQSAQEVRIEI